MNKVDEERLFIQTVENNTPFYFRYFDQDPAIPSLHHRKYNGHPFSKLLSEQYEKCRNDKRLSRQKLLPLIIAKGETTFHKEVFSFAYTLTADTLGAVMWKFRPNNSKNFSIFNSVLTTLYLAIEMGLEISPFTDISQLFVVCGGQIILLPEPLRQREETNPLNLCKALIELAELAYPAYRKELRGRKNKDILHLNETIVTLYSLLLEEKGYAKSYFDYANIVTSIYPFQLDFQKLRELQHAMYSICSTKITGDIQTVLMRNWKSQRYVHENVSAIETKLKDSGFIVDVIENNDSQSNEIDDQVILRKIEEDVKNEPNLCTIILFTGDGGRGDERGYIERLRKLRKRYSRLAKIIIIAPPHSTAEEYKNDHDSFEYKNFYSYFFSILKGN